jgi:hypothetical protein
MKLVRTLTGVLAATAVLGSTVAYIMRRTTRGKNSVEVTDITEEAD